MSRTFNVFAFFAAAMLVACVGFSAASLVGSSPTDRSRVHDFVVSESKDSASWTAFGRQWNVVLELSDVVEDNSDYYLGSLDGDASAAVSFALLPGQDLSGMIATGDVTYWIRALPVPENNHSEEEGDLGIFMVRETVTLDLLTNGVPSFGEPLVAEAEEPACATAASSERSVEQRTISSYKVAVVVDQKWATASNNPWSSQANTLALFNDVNAVYKASGLGTFTAVYVKQITNSQSGLTNMLNYFSSSSATSQFSTQIKDTSFTQYIWLVGTNVGGLAWVGSACKGTSSSQNKKTAVAGLANYSRLWTVKTIAHELGHTRGASHYFTGACSGSVKSNCQCSVMSYCFPTSSNNPKGAVNFFADISISQMKAAGCY